MENQHESERDTIHISPWLVKVLSSSILGGLGLIGAYMIQWNRTDGAFKERVVLSLIQLEAQANRTNEVIKVIPTNTRAIEEHERRLNNLEDDHAAVRRRRGD